MNHEKIKVGETTYDIANGSCSLNTSDGGPASVAIIIGSNTIDSIHKNLSENTTITKYASDDAEEWQKTNLVYTGKMTLKSDFPVGIEQTQTGTDADGNPVYSNVEATDSVVIVEYRTPTTTDRINDLEEQNTELTAQVAYLQMMSDIEEV